MAGLFSAPTFTPDVALILDLCSETALRQSVQVFAEAMKDSRSFTAEDGSAEVFPDGDFAAEVHNLETDIVRTIKEAARKASDSDAVQEGLEAVVKGFYATRSSSGTKQRRAGDPGVPPVVVPSKEDIHAAVEAAMRRQMLAPSAPPDISPSFLDDPQLADVAQLAAADLAQLAEQLYTYRRKRSSSDFVTVADLRAAIGLVGNVASADLRADELDRVDGSGRTGGLLDKRDATGDRLLCIGSLAGLALDVVMLFLPFLCPSAVLVASRQADAIRKAISTRLESLVPQVISRLSELARLLADFRTVVAEGKLGQIFRLLFEFFSILFNFGVVGAVIQVLCSGMGWKDAILFGVSTAVALAAFFGSGGASLTLQAVAILAALASVALSAMDAVEKCYV